eukprot:4652917-Pleurochrysis_carterae.AAC.1
MNGKSRVEHVKVQLCTPSRTPAAVSSCEQSPCALARAASSPAASCLSWWLMCACATAPR